MPSKAEVLNQSLKRRLRKDESKNNENQTLTQKRPNRRGKDAKWELDDIMINSTKEQQLRVKHHLFPALNACRIPLDDMNELQDFPSITVSMPIPVHVAQKHCDHVDLCHRRTLARERYTNRLLTAYTCSKRSLKNKRFNTLQKDGIYSGSMFDLAERLETNPDPFFNSSYDYYYTGGNLCVLPFSRYVVHADGDGLKDLNISRFSGKKRITTAPLRNLHHGTVGKSSEILQVIPFILQRDNNIDYFSIRERNSITLYSINEEGQPKGITQFNNMSTPFISFAQSVSDFNKFVVTNMKQHIRLFDLNSSETLLSEHFEVGEMDWNVVKGWREHTYLYANSKQLYLLDVRTSPSEWRKTVSTFGPNEFFCENIVNLALSNFKKLFYIGSSHKLYSHDIRCWSKYLEGSATICRWVHQLKYPPLLLETFRSESSEYVALSSALADDWRICELNRAGEVADSLERKSLLDGSNFRQKYVYKSTSLPFQPTTLSEAYEAARLHGKCLRPDADMKERINCCTTGLAFYENYENKYAQTALLTSNSNGDVFAHELGKRESQEHKPRTSPFTDEVMCKFEETICRLKQRPLNYTEIKCMKDMSKVFRCSQLNPENIITDDCIDDNKDDIRTIPRTLGRWQESMQDLHSYKDVLVKNLLSIWDIDYEEENNITLSELSKTESTKPDSISLVSSWLNRNTNEPPLVQVPCENINETYNDLKELLPNGALHSTQIINDNIVQEQLDHLESENLDNSHILNASIQTSQTKRKRRSYVKGF